MATNYKQYDSRWTNYPYAGESMGPAGCGPTATADILDKSPVEIANWMTNHGYASNGSGTYQAGITAAIRAYGYSAAQLTGSSRAGVMNDSTFETFKSSIQSGNCGILLMGGLNTGCRNSYWTRGGHYIAIVGYSNGQYKVYDPASTARDGWHPWSDFQGNIKHVYTTSVKWGSGVTTTTSANNSATYSFNPAQIRKGDNNVSVLLAQEILKARGIYKGGLDRSFGPLMDAAVRTYQKQRKLTVDGICGPATWKDLLGK